MKFYICKKCGNIVNKVRDSGIPVVCCGENMSELIPNTEDAAREKHVPVYEIIGNTVEFTVGETEHPMTEEHHIQWIALKTNLGNHRKELKPGEEPKAQFALLDNEKIEKVYSYCNLHGLWMAECDC